MLTIHVDSKYADWNDVFYLKIEYIGNPETEKTIPLNIDSSTMYSREHYHFPFTIHGLDGDRLLFRLGFTEPGTHNVVLVDQKDLYRVVDAFF